MAILLCLMIAPFCQRQLLSTVVFGLKSSSDKFSFQVCIRQKKPDPDCKLFADPIQYWFTKGCKAAHLNMTQHNLNHWNWSKNRTSSSGPFIIIDLQLIQVNLKDHPNYLQWSLMMINELVVCYEKWPRIFCQWYSGAFHGKHRIIDKMSNLSTAVSEYQSHFSSFYCS